MVTKPSPEEEVKRILRVWDNGTFTVPIETVSEQIVKLFSTPPVVGDLREKIFNTLVENCPHVDNCGKECTVSDREKCYNTLADSILALLKEAGYVKLDALQFNPDYLDFQKGVVEGRKLGARELAEWVNNFRFADPQLIPESGREPIVICIPNEEWQSKLKELK